MIALLVTLVYFPLVGWALLRLLAEEPALTRVEWYAAAVLAGVGGSGSLLFLLGLAGLPMTLAVMLSPAAVAAVVLIVTRRRRRLPLSDARYPKLATLMLLVPIIVISMDTAALPLRDYDGRVFWLLKGKAIAHEGSITGPFFQGETTRNAHSHYPLLVPLDAAVIFSLTGDLENRHVRWLFGLVAIAFLLFVRGRLAAITGPAAAGWTAAVIAWLPQFSFAIYGGAVSAYAEIALIAFTAGALFDVQQMALGRLVPSTLAVWTTFLVLTKNEGTVISAILFVVAAAAAGRERRSIRLLATSALAPLVAFAALLAWRARVPLEHDENYLALIPQLPQKLGLVPVAARELFSRMLDLDSWALFWPVAGAALVLALASSEWKAAVRSLFVAAAIGATYVAIYTVTNWSIPELAASSANRLLMHLLPSASVILALGIRSQNEGAP